MMQILTANESDEIDNNLLEVNKLLVQNTMPSGFVFSHELYAVHEHVCQDTSPQKRAESGLEVALVLMYSSLLRLRACGFDECNWGYTLCGFADVFLHLFFEFSDGEIVVGNDGAIVHLWRGNMVVSGVVGKVKANLLTVRRSKAWSRKRWV